jgi:hypothetical protein
MRPLYGKANLSMYVANQNNIELTVRTMGTSLEAR